MKQLIFIEAPWCNACHAIKPLAESICKRYGVELIVYDMEADPYSCGKYNPTGLPFIACKDYSIAGSACSRSSIEAMVKGMV
jgi:thiol-disulfide isomerase/thioredoxin